MTDKNHSELEVLRKRAYGPRADIHLDPQAVRRLRELESQSRPSPAPTARTDDEAAPPELSAAVITNAAEHPAAEGDQPRTGIDWSWARELFFRMLRIRRSTALIVLSAAVVVVLAMTALTLVQRVQVDPLQVGAEQVARLSIDYSYGIPEILEGGPGELETFQEFYGLRTIAAFDAEQWYFAAGSGDCFSVFSEADMEFTSNSFSGPMMSTCGAGDFPATVQFGITAEAAPEELRAAFPDSTAFQFVLDADNREIVVFMSQ
ncbi:MAG: hypothetical protein ACOH19_00655 [Rhodoglobus sp.]